jgi:excisionase family DNA binding protein
MVRVRRHGGNGLHDTLEGRLTLTVAEVAEATGLHQRTVRRHIDQGRLKSVLVGGRRLVKVDDLRRFIDGK